MKRRQGREAGQWEFLKTSGLSLERLVTFLKVCDCGSISAAAAADASEAAPGRPDLQDEIRARREPLFVRQLNELEAHVGTPLTVKLGRRRVVNETGRRYAAIVRGSFKSLDDFYKQAADVAPSYSLAAGKTLVTLLVAPVLSELLRVLPARARIEIDDDSSTKILGRVGDYTLDFGLVRQSALPPKRKGSPLDWETIGEFGFAFYLPKTRPPVDLGDAATLKGIRLATLGGAGEFPQALHRAMKEADLQLNVRAECTSFSHALALLETGHFAAIMPDFTPLPEIPGKKFEKRRWEPLDGHRRRIALVWNRQGAASRGLSQEALGRIVEILRGRFVRMVESR